MLGVQDWFYIIYFVVDILEMLFQYVVLNNQCYFCFGQEFVGIFFYEVVKCVLGVDKELEDVDEVIFERKDKGVEFFFVDFY